MNTGPEKEHAWLQQPVGEWTSEVVATMEPDHRVLTSHVLGDDGTWHEFMVASDRRWR